MRANNSSYIYYLFVLLGREKRDNRNMNCPRCKVDNNYKAGVINGQQRYKCKSCNYYYTVSQKSTGVSNDVKRLGIEMYLAGVGYNSIGRVLDVSHVTVQQWIKGYERIKELKSDTPIKIIDFKDLIKEVSPKGKAIQPGLLIHALYSGHTSSYWVLGEQKEVRKYGEKNRVRKK